MSQLSVADGQEEDRVIRQPPFAPDQGVYLQAEAAFLAGLPSAGVRRWLQIVRGAESQAAIDGPTLVSFLDLISLRAVVALRAAKLKSVDIRDGVHRMRTELGFDRPLACEDLKNDGLDRYFCRSGRGVAESVNGHLPAQSLVDQYLRDVHYTAGAGGQRIATSWEPSGVSLNPRVQRGAPCVRGTRIQVAVLRRFADAGDSPELLAEMYDLSVDQVVTALTWYGQLKHQAA